MGNYSQEGRPLRVETSLGPDALLLEGISGEEGVSSPFRFHLDLLSEDPALDAAGLLRSPVSVTVELVDGERIIHGLINRFVQGEQLAGSDLTTYRAEVVPWLWFLSLSSDCRIFQNLSVLEIVEQVFEAQGYSDFELRCVRSYPKREYCVQYRETHLNFVSRLLEEEGIFYFFDHSSSKHVLVLGDDPTAVKPCPGQATARAATVAGKSQDEDVVTALEREHAARIGRVTLRDYDFLKPSNRLEGSISGNGKEEIYDYPGSFTELDAGERLARLQLEEHELLSEVVRGESTCRAFRSGSTFDLKDHYRKDVNQAYHLLQVGHSARLEVYRTRGGGDFEYRNDFLAIPQKVPYRPPRVTPKPVVEGAQTAVVVGKAGEEIWVDKHGRVKVQFFWDREGNKDEKSSCWVRVSSSWAGKGWGVLQIPRIGQEVIIDFLEGDPDRPIVTGRVYNAEQTPPYPLPSDQTQSGIKSRSSKDGGTDNCNELRFEDKKGSELVLIHAEKDLSVEVENDETRDVGHDRTTVVANDDTRTVKRGNDAVVIENGDQTVDVQMGDRKVTLAQGDQNVVLKMGDLNLQLDMGDISTNAKLGNVSTKADLGKVSEEAMQGIELKVGQSSVKIDQTGVTIKGMQVKIEGQIQTEVKGLMTNVKGDAMLKVQGGITMIN